MRFAATIEPGCMTIRRGAFPELRPDQALVRVEAVGLCGSDYHLFDGTHPYACYPLTQGHEVVGVIDSLAPGYQGRRAVGERVAVDPLIPDGTCFACRRGRDNCCANLAVIGVQVPGGLAELIAVGAESLHPLGDLPTRVAVLAEPVSIGLQTVARGDVHAGDRVVVLGAGPIGLAAVLAASDRGASVLVADRHVNRLEMALRSGATVAVDTSRAELIGPVRHFTDGDGPAVIVEATGDPDLLRTAFDLVAYSGSIVVVGISGLTAEIPVIDFSRKEVQVMGARNSHHAIPEAIDLLRRRQREANGWVTHVFDLDNAPDAIAYGSSHPSDVGKIIVRIGPWAS